MTFPPSPPEQRLVAALKLAFPDAEAQYRLANYYADCAIPSLRVVVEYDGQRWHDPAQDAKRDAKLAEMGWRTIRITKATLPAILADPFSVRWL